MDTKISIEAVVKNIDLKCFTAKNFTKKLHYFLQPDQTLAEAFDLLSINEVNEVPVVTSNKKILGIVSTNQMIKEIQNNDYLKNMPVSRIMNCKYHVIKEEEGLVELLKYSPSEIIYVIDNNHCLVGYLSSSELNIVLLYCLLQANEEFGKIFKKIDLYTRIINNTFEGFIFINNNGVVEEINSFYINYLNRSKEELVGKKIYEILEDTKGIFEVMKTGIPQKAYIKNFHGERIIINRIPIVEEERIIGAVALRNYYREAEFYEIYERLQKTANPIICTEFNSLSKYELKKDCTFDNILGYSDAIVKTKKLAMSSAKTPFTVLLSGETGTGKDLFAKAIHNYSNFSNGKFVCVNCAAIPEQLLESELFGYVDGSFTGAKKGGKLGKIEEANGGTLFLDEIGDMPLIMQPKLLRVIEEKEFEPVGGLSKIKVNMRIVAATNLNLQQMVHEGKFRADLFYRLNAINILVPPLRQRKEDIRYLLEYYMKSTCMLLGLDVKKFDEDSLLSLENYDWPGNVRELINFVEMMVVTLNKSLIKNEDLPEYFRVKQNEIKDVPESAISDNIKTAVYEAEREIIQKTLDEVMGNKTAAAKKLGINRSTLYDKLKRYDLFA